ncbi:MAG: hypothetical protein NTY03_01370, partial [Candidatus Bathyarchaeota archaeon]|nr:hypothetical protein [Candidatus Bathyarchaeota archaeon]
MSKENLNSNKSWGLRYFLILIGVVLMLAGLYSHDTRTFVTGSFCLVLGLGIVWLIRDESKTVR